MSKTNACTLTLDDGTHYDLSSLSSSKADYVAQAGNTSYKLNVCRSVVSEVWKLDDPETVGGFVSRLDGDFSIGSVNSTLLLSPSTNEPLLVMSNGSPCPLNPSASASSAIHFVCSPSDYSAGTPVLIASLPPGDPDNACQFFFEWKTHVACQTSPKAQLEASHYVAFGVILAIAIITWFAGHTLYNRYYLKLRGREQFPFPSLSFPSIRLPSFKKSSSEGFGINNPNGTSKPGWGSWRRRSQRPGGYNHIRAEEIDEEEGFAGRFSLDDDEDEDGGMEDARALGNEANAWRSHSGTGNIGGGGTQEGRVGLHQGLVDI